jgi:hypothetical protein
MYETKDSEGLETTREELEEENILFKKAPTLKELKKSGQAESENEVKDIKSGNSIFSKISSDSFGNALDFIVFFVVFIVQIIILYYGIMYLANGDYKMVLSSAILSCPVLYLIHKMSNT